jgi:hypothetical protein
MAGKTTEEREAAIDEALAIQDRAVEKHAPLLQSAITEAMIEVAQRLPFGGGPDTPTTHFRRIDEAMRALYRESTREMSASMVGRIKRGFLWLETKAQEDDFYERLFEQYMQTYGGNRIAQISQTTRRQIVKLIESGLKQGLSLPEIADEIMSAAPVVGETRAHVIARTETHSAAMFASLESAKRSTIPLVKEWASVEDGRTRDFGEGDGVVDEFSHRVMDGVRVAIDEPFEVPNRGGFTELLMYPGDPAGSAANVINCRCAQTYVPADDTDEDEPDPTPQQRQPGGPAFRYQTMEDPPARTAALNDWIVENGIAGRADLKGVTAKEIAPLMRYMLEVHERFGLDPVVAVGPAARFTNRARRMRANAAIYPTFTDDQGRRGIWHMPTSFGNRKRYEQQQDISDYWRRDGKYTRKRRAVLDQSRFIDDEVRTRAQRMDQEGQPWDFTLNAPDEPDLHRRKIIYHEYGHVVHLTNTANPRMGEEIDDVLRRIGHPGSGWGYLLSDYANSNSRELVAESFSLYMSGPPDQYYRIHPDLLAIFRRYDRAVGEASTQLVGLPIMKPETIKLDMSPETDGVALIREILANPERRDELVAAYTGDDLDMIEPYIDEALALIVDMD